MKKRPTREIAKPSAIPEQNSANFIPKSGATEARHEHILRALSTSHQQLRQVVAPVAKHGRRQELGFAAETAALTGESLRSIQRHLARAVALGDDLDRITGTSLDKGVEMDALAKLPEPQREELIERAVAGEKVSAVSEMQTTHIKVTVRSRTLLGLRKKLLHALEIVETHISEGGVQ